MRISTLQIFNIANKGMADANRSMIRTQEQLSSGLRVLNPSDDPVASTKIMQLSSEISNIEQYRKNINIAENNLVLEESSITSVSNLLQRIQELAVQAGNTATLSTNEYSALASEVDARLDEMENILNSQNANGDYIFGGYKSTQAPFVGNAASGFEYRGDDGQQLIKIANNTTIQASDSGKSIFVDVVSAENTVNTYTSSANLSDPPIRVSVGQITDQDAYDMFYPQDMVVTFNPDNAVIPPGKNFNITERSTGRTLVTNQAYVSGEAIEMNGASFRITGNPMSGAAISPATIDFGAVIANDFTPPGDETFTIRVGSTTETFILDANVTNGADLAAILNSGVNGNAGRLVNLGMSVTALGFQVDSGQNFTIENGTALTSAAMGMDTVAGTTSIDGRLRSGDRVFIDSSNKQDALTTLARFSQSMKDYDGSNEGRQILEAQVASAIDNLKNAQTSILDTTSKLGARFNTLESTRELHLDSELVMKDVLAELRDVDYAEAATRLSGQTLVLQAAQSAFIRVSQLNLFSQL